MSVSAEPSIEALGGPGLLASVRRAGLATRPGFLVASVLPVLVGTTWGAQSGAGLDGLALCLALGAAVLMAAAANVWNDVCDDACGTDRLNTEHIYPFSGGSRFIQNGVLSANQMGRLAAALALAAALLGAILIWRHGWPVLGFGLAGLALGVFYSWPPVQLAGRGLGELAVGLAYGVLPVCGAAWLQSSLWDKDALWLSIPVSAWIAAVLLINEVPDREADAAVGKRTLPVRVGRVSTAGLYAGLQLLGLAGVATWAGLAGLPAWPLVFFACFAAVAWVAASRVARDPAAVGPTMRLTLAVHAAGCAGLIVWMLLAA